MTDGPTRPTGVIWLGVIFLLCGILAVPLLISDPTSTGRVLPIWSAVLALWVGGTCVVAWGWYWRARRRPTRWA
ncbi:hypothetical protein [Microbacterium hydrothermale]|uniref:hypothetical protein n=1 Tax=Microbacterium hydrothermale TaxID=857427 RepID=UPI0010A94A7B|nr:hypothetical protein [Microbacterium hydrothermale]